MRLGLSLLGTYADHRSRLRAWMVRFKGVATKYLTNYFGWFRALDRSPRFSPDPAQVLALAVRA